MIAAAAAVKRLRAAFDNPACIQRMSAREAREVAESAIRSYKGQAADNAIASDLGRHLEISEYIADRRRLVDAAEFERQRADDTDKLAREAVELYDGERRKREAVEAELERAQALLAAAGDHPDYASLLADYKRLLARALERGWEQLTAIP